MGSTIVGSDVFEHGSARYCEPWLLQGLAPTIAITTRRVAQRGLYSLVPKKELHL